MQHVFEVASLSPPGATNATQPAATAAKVPKGESFDLLLSKATDNIQKEESIRDEPANRPDSPMVEPAASSWKKEKPNETDKNKEIKNSKSKDTEESEKEDTPTDNTETMVAVISNGQIIDEQSINDLAVEIDDQQMDDLKLNDQNSLTLGQEFKSTKPNQEPVFSIGDENDQQVNPAENLIQKMNIDQNVKDQSDLNNELKMTEADLLEEKPMVTFSNQPSSDPKKEKQAGSIVQELSAVEMKSKEKIAGVSEKIVTTGEDQEVKLAQKQDLRTSEKVPELEEEKLQAVETRPGSSSDSAPPGTNIKQDSVIPPNTQVSQSYEPARLAEAPKAETISQISNQIESMVKANRSSIRVQLYPEELGHIDLRIVSNRNGVGVTMVADKSTTQEVLRSEMNLLKQSIEQAGIQLSDLNIGQGQSSGQQQLAEERRGQNRFSYKSGEINNQELDGKNNNVILQTSVVDYKV